MLKKLFKYLLLFIGLLIVLLIGALAYTQTASFREFLRVKVLEVANPYFNGKLAIGRIDGNLYNSIHLSNVALTEGDSTVLSIDSVYLNYRLVDLSTKHIQLDTVFFQSPQFNLWYKDSTTLHLMYVFDKIIEIANSTPSNFPIILDVKDIAFEDGQGKYQLSYGKEPIVFQKINMEASGYFKKEHVELTLHAMNIKTDNPDFELQQGRFHALKQRSIIQADSIYLKTRASELSADVRYVSNNDFKLRLEANPLDKSDVVTFLPDLPLRSISELKFGLESDDEVLQCDVLLAKGRKHVGLNGSFFNLPEALKDSSQTSEYNAIMFFNEFVPEEWFEIDQTGAFLNGSLAVDGDNVFDYKSDVNVKARFNHSSYQNTVADTLHFDASQVNKLIKAETLVVYNNSHSEGHLTINDLYETPVYSANFMTRNLDIGAIQPSAKNTIVNGHIVLSGRHILSDERNFITHAELYDSKVYDIGVDTVVLRSAFKGTSLRIDTLAFIVQDNTVISSGTVDFDTFDFDTQTKIRSRYLGFLKKFDVPEFSFNEANLNLSLAGNLDSVSYQGEMSVFNFGYDSMYVDIINANAMGRYQPDSLSARGVISLLKFSNQGQNLDSLRLQFDYANNSLWTLINLAREDTIRASVESELSIQDTVELHLAAAEVEFPWTHFYLTDARQMLKYHNSSLLIDGLEIKDKDNEDFSLRANGSLSANNVENFELDMDNLNLHLFNHFIESSDSIGGQLSLAAKLMGSPDSVILKGDYQLRNIYFNEIVAPKLEGHLAYAVDTFAVDVWSPDLDSTVYANAHLPIKLILDSAGYSMKVPETFKAEVVVDSLEVVTPDIPEFAHVKAGILVDGKVRAEGAFDKPLFYGQINLDNGFVDDHEQGVYYKDVHGQLVFRENNLNVDTFYIGSTKGYYASKGHLLFDSTLVSGKIIASNIETDIKNFQVVQHKNYDVNISGNPHYRSDIEGEPRFGGGILVNRSSFYIPGLVTNDEDQKHTKSTPLLVVAIHENDSTYRIEQEVEEEEMSPFMQQLKGRLNIEIPRSTWLKSDDMNIEISGDMDVAKTADYFELFGDVEVVRGYYILYGRKFNIEEGIITFMGGETLDPRLEVSADYVFRGSDKEKHTLELSISEYLSEPEISFTLDGVSISQSDAVSIMVFGKTMDELSYDGQNGIVGSVGSNMLANMVTSSLNNTIGQRFKLDMIEVNSTQNWETAAFVVGKYITNDLFVIYQRGFGETEDDEITPESITLEYELSKVLFFRLQSGSSKTSGFDVILKFESSK
ncbi:translocation/assembly module TamB [Carboxylicivirga sp. A043]|uniref:translocation/assembly module TamB domain-containing protein n=1 Tax=Carboxylicivirga litoralis TaxID=2816963 RepID=UPI0021CB3D05|nr:translocation/assembly module TamB [Carboxylicivirga sp. A043]MCU4155010.1 translocation/assembly module TamB [Carboxylicivirga sp. A043]